MAPRMPRTVAPKRRAWRQATPAPNRAVLPASIPAEPCGATSRSRPDGDEPLCLAAAEPKAGLAFEDSRGIEKNRGIGDPSGPESGGVHPGVGQSWGNQSSPGTDEDQVEAALARALDRASEAGRFDVVAQLARELEARRLGRLPNAVPLDPDGRGNRLP